MKNPPRSVIVATRNAHKTEEIRQILGPDFFVTDLSQRGDIPEIAETGETFAANAILKALAVSQRLAGLVLADDSGLEVNVLGGAPGVRSARYAGEPADDRKNVEKLLAAVQQIDPRGLQRNARFRCVIAIAAAGNVLNTFQGEATGRIIDSPRGFGGFGYDPVFVPTGYDLTFGELPTEVKNQLSHRSRALAAAKPTLATAAGE
ncbi:MAG: RdgB/HAM1 family non-canonical purine NTP pyrophosphatase [Chthoniobacterales bacterium]